MSLSNFNPQIFTIYNRITKGQESSEFAYAMRQRVENCASVGGVLDRTSGIMANRASTWTAFLHDWQRYKPPHWDKGGFYALSDSEKRGTYTVNVGDLIVFGNVTDKAPESLREFNALCEKYKNNGGVVTSCQAYIMFDAQGRPWSTNHIEAVKG